MPLFPKKPKYTIVKVAKKRGDIPSDLWTRCEDCKELIYNKKLDENMRICPNCNFHFNLGAHERVKATVDEGSFKEMDAELESLDPLSFEGPKTYKDKIKKDQELTNLKEAVIIGEAAIDGRKIILGVTDSRFIMGSMGSVVGE